MSFGTFHGVFPVGSSAIYQAISHRSLLFSFYNSKTMLSPGLITQTSSPALATSRTQTWLTETQQAQLLRLWGTLAHVLNSCWPELEIRSQKCHGKAMCPWNTRKKERSRNGLCICKLLLLLPFPRTSPFSLCCRPFSRCFISWVKASSIPCLCSSHMKEHLSKARPYGECRSRYDRHPALKGYTNSLGRFGRHKGNT